VQQSRAPAEARVVRVRVRVRGRVRVRVRVGARARLRVGRASRCACGPPRRGAACSRGPRERESEGRYKGGVGEM
jgi:hypothetical protein